MKIEEFEKLAKKAGLDKKQIEEMKLLAVFSEDLLHRFKPYLEARALLQANQTPFMNPSDDAKGLINFAVSQEEKEIGVFPEEPHMLIVGMTRSGKTTLLLRILSQILKFQNE
jgi:polynucleotide 5'-kinase involved in rRNA processing